MSSAPTMRAVGWVPMTLATSLDLVPPAASLPPASSEPAFSDLPSFLDKVPKSRDFFSFCSLLLGFLPLPLSAAVAAAVPLLPLLSASGFLTLLLLSPLAAFSLFLPLLPPVRERKRLFSLPLDWLELLASSKLERRGAAAAPSVLNCWICRNLLK